MKVAQTTRESHLARVGGVGGVRWGIHGARLRAQRTIPACKPECALQGRWGIHGAMLRAQRTIPACKPECALQGRWGIHAACSAPSGQFRRASRNALCTGGNGHCFDHLGRRSGAMTVGAVCQAPAAASRATLRISHLFGEVSSGGALLRHTSIQAVPSRRARIPPPWNS